MSDTIDTLIHPRREFLTRLGAAGLGVAAGTLIAGCGGSSSSGGAQAATFDPAEMRRAFQDIKQDEDDHVTFLRTALGGSARPVPTFSDAALTAPDLATFITDSAALENTGTGAYLYVVNAPALLSSPANLQAAASIALVEGRHAGFLNALKDRVLLTDPNAGDTTGPNNDSREVAQPPSQVQTRATPFLANVNLNGGAGFPPDSVNTSSDLLLILNYALLLEELEKRFYDINVPRFFP